MPINLPGIKKYIRLTLIQLLSLAAASTQADIIGNPNSSFQLQGFLSMVGGKFYGGSLVPDQSTPFQQGNRIPCPCFVSNWANAGVYSENRFTVRPDSIAGLQADYKIDPMNSFSTQVTSRGGIMTPTVQWFYLDHQFTPHWDVHIGRQRVPLFYYSASQDVGLSYPWIVPPEELYGYEVTNYNGMSISYSSSWQGVSSRIEAYTGFEYIHNSPYAGLIENWQQSSVRWKNMLGSAWTLSRDFWTLHINYLTAQVNWSGAQTVNLQRLNTYGAALNMDFDTFFLTSEYGQFVRNNYQVFGNPYGNSGYTETEPAYYVTAGTRWHNFTPSLTYSKFLDHYTYQMPQSPIPLFPNGGWKATLRYDINDVSDLKIQYDTHDDLGESFYTTGNGKLIRISYDRVF